jgi:hypothetical protein
MTVLKSNAAVDTESAAPARRKPKHRRDAAVSRLPVSLVAVIVAIGLLVVSAAYTSARLGTYGSAWADRAYWLGQILIVAPVAARLISRAAITEAATVGLVSILTVAEFLVYVCYSPLSFTFPDELWHWRSTVDMLHTGKLFTVNYALPISPRYPGLEELTSALAQITRLSLFSSGLIVAGTAHLLFIILIFIILRLITQSHRLAGVAIVIYFSTPDLSSFDSMYVYQTLALTFMALALLYAWRATELGAVSGSLVIAILAIVATVVTHHTTSYFLAATLLLLTATTAAARHLRHTAILGSLALAAIGTIALWIYYVAPGTISYFAPTVAAIEHGIENVTSPGHSAVSASPATPFSDEALGIVAVLIVSLLIPLGLIRIWRQARHQPWIVAMAVGSLCWYAIVVVRFTVADGSQLAGRAATLVDIPVSLVVAIAIARPIFRTAVTVTRASLAAMAVFATAVLLVFDGLANGWPPFWERLPGTYQVAGFERSVNPEGIAAAQWALAKLGPGNRFAADTGNYPVMASYGYQNPVRNIAYLYTSAQFSPADAQEATEQNLQYLLIDLRLSQSLPVSGSYFPIDPNSGAYKHPIPVADLTKFNAISSIARIYDSGDLIIYDLKGF